jgi:hypothetical protein
LWFSSCPLILIPPSLPPSLPTHSTKFADENFQLKARIKPVKGGREGGREGREDRRNLET